MVTKKRTAAGLMLGAIGIVFGDIGTSPLYALQAIFGPLGRHLPITTQNVTGIISLVIWAVILVVSVKYIGFIMRADNEGEGGIMALVALIRSNPAKHRYGWLFLLLGLVGTSLFYGDSAITPAISVLSAVEGLKLVTPSISSLVVPITIVILTALFWLQKYGTSKIGSLFGPIMLLWFIAIAAGGLYRIVQYPDVLTSLSPLTAGAFIINQPLIAFVALGAGILAVTGAEALYADMGHFGRPPIARAWFLVVFPALSLCYLGQGTLLLHDPSSAAGSFVALFPATIRIPIVVLATFATLIASQSVISGAFSITRQAVQLDLLPKMLIRHTSIRETGQIYMPFINFLLYAAVIFLVLFFASSQKLAGAYGVAVSGTLAIDTILYLYVTYGSARAPLLKTALLAIAFLCVDVTFVAASIPKLLSGGWLPAMLAFMIFILIDTWIKGQLIITRERKKLEGHLQTYIDKIHNAMPSLSRVPGQAVYIGHHADYAPLAFHTSVEENHELHEKVVIISVEISSSPHIPEDKRAKFDRLKYNDGISHLSLTYGYHDSPNIPKTIASLRHLDPDLDFNPDKAAYFVSMSKVVQTRRHNLASWRKTVYVYMDRNATSMTDYLKLPHDRTTEMRSMLEL